MSLLSIYYESMKSIMNLQSDHQCKGRKHKVLIMNFDQIFQTFSQLGRDYKMIAKPFIK